MNAFDQYNKVMQKNKKFEQLSKKEQLAFTSIETNEKVIVKEKKPKKPDVTLQAFKNMSKHDLITKYKNKKLKIDSIVYPNVVYRGKYDGIHFQASVIVDKDFGEKARVSDFKHDNLTLEHVLELDDMFESFTIPKTT